MVAAFEILIANHPVRNIIREGKTHQLPERDHDEPAGGHVHPGGEPGRPRRAQLITYEDALAISSHPKELDRLMGHRGRHARDCVTIGTAARRGPNLPYSLVAGVTPCGPAGWSPAPSSRARSSRPRTPARSRPFIEVVDQRPTTR